MNKQNLLKKGLWGFLFIIMLAGCASAKESPIFEVVFDGNDCTVTGPSELPPGEYSFTFKDQSEWEAELWLVYLDDGKTIQDQLDLQTEPGEYVPKPDWAHYDDCVSHDSKDSVDGRIDTETWSLEVIGEHNILCYVPTPLKIWFAAPIQIEE